MFTFIAVLAFALVGATAWAQTDELTCAQQEVSNAGDSLSSFATWEQGPCLDFSATRASNTLFPVPSGMNASQCTGDKSIASNPTQLALCTGTCADNSSGYQSNISLPFLLCTNETNTVCACGFVEAAFVNASHCQLSEPGFLRSAIVAPACLYENKSVCILESNTACVWDGSGCCRVNRGENVGPYLPWGMSQALMWIVVVVFILLMVQSVIMCFMHRRRIRGYISGIRTRAQARDILDSFMESLGDFHPVPQPGTQPVAIGNVNGVSSDGTVLSGTALLGGTPGDECAICLNDMASKRAVQLVCMHCFHRECIEDLLQHELVLKNEVSCPLCRSVFMQVPADRLIITSDAAR